MEKINNWGKKLESKLLSYKEMKTEMEASLEKPSFVKDNKARRHEEKLNKQKLEKKIAEEVKIEEARQKKKLEYEKKLSEDKPSKKETKKSR